MPSNCIGRRGHDEDIDPLYMMIPSIDPKNGRGMFGPCVPLNGLRRLLWSLAVSSLAVGCASRPLAQEASYARLQLGPSGAERLGGQSGDWLLRIYLADVPAATRRTADSLAIAHGTVPVCSRYYSHGEHFVIWLAPFCAGGPSGKALDAQTLFAIDRSGKMVGQELRWLTPDQIRTVWE